MDNEVDANVATMSLGELVGHSMVLPMYGASAESVTGEQAEANRSIYAADTPREIIEAIRPGGVLLLDRIAFHPRFGDLPLASVVSPAQLTEYTEELQSVARSAGLANLLIVTDQEGGRVNRLPTPPLPSASSIGATSRPDLARAAGELTGRIASSFGVNVVFGPVADIGVANSAIGDRSFGADPRAVAEMVVATVDGITAAGVAAVAKHWPGHGRADADSHVSLPTLDVSASEWREAELLPFDAAVQAGTDAVAVAHLSAPALDPSGRPASASASLVRLLREVTGFAGVTFSDALWMPAIRRFAPTDPEAAAAVLGAGVDLLLAPPDPWGTMESIDTAGAGDELRASLEASATRTFALRRRLGAAAQRPDGTDWSEEIRRLAADIGTASEGANPS